LFVVSLNVLQNGECERCISRLARTRPHAPSAVSSTRSTPVLTLNEHIHRHRPWGAVWMIEPCRNESTAAHCRHQIHRGPGFAGNRAVAVAWLMGKHEQALASMGHGVVGVACPSCPSFGSSTACLQVHTVRRYLRTPYLCPSCLQVHRVPLSITLSSLEHHTLVIYPNTVVVT